MSATYRFALGRVVATPGALNLLHENGVTPTGLLQRHQQGDWGDVCPDDANVNEEALRMGFRLLSSYPVGQQKVWIITEADRSVTTLLLPEEY